MATTTHVYEDLAHPSARAMRLRMLADNWWWLLLRGIAAVVLGILTFVWPGLALLTLIVMWGIYLLVDGIAALAGAVMGPGMAEARPRWWLAIAGLIGIAAGTAVLAWPGLSGRLLLILIAAWAVAMGAAQIWGALLLRKDIEGEWLLGLSGLLAIGFGLFLLGLPGAGALAIAWMIATFAIVFGILEIALAFELKAHARDR